MRADAIAITLFHYLLLVNMIYCLWDTRWGRGKGCIYITPTLKTEIRAIFFLQETWRVRRTGRGRIRIDTSVMMFREALA